MSATGMGAGTPAGANTPIQLVNSPTTTRFVNFDQVLVQARSSEEVEPAMEQIADTLRERHHLRRSQPDDFILRDQLKLIISECT